MSFFTRKSWFDKTSPDLFNTQDLQTQQQISQSTFLSQSTTQSQFLSNQASNEFDFTIVSESEGNFFTAKKKSQYSQLTSSVIAINDDDEEVIHSNHIKPCAPPASIIKFHEDVRESHSKSTLLSQSQFSSNQASNEFYPTFESQYSHSKSTLLSQSQFSSNQASNEFDFTIVSESEGNFFTAKQKSQHSQLTSPVIAINDDDGEVIHSNHIKPCAPPASIIKFHEDVGGSQSDSTLLSHSQISSNQASNEFYPTFESQYKGSFFTANAKQESQYSQLTSSVIAINDDDEEVIHSNHIKPCLPPASIAKLYKDVRESHSDWVFVSLILTQLCFDRFPKSAYSNLKLSLLLSLVSINQSPPIAIIALGQETSHANIIMNHIGKFADRFVTSTLADFDKTIVKPNGMIEAGPLLMAKCGVLSIGYWSRLNQRNVLKLLREIETGAVTTEKVQQRVPLECAIWSYWSVSTKVKKDSSDINQFVNIFGIPIMIDDLNNEEEIIDHLMNFEDIDEQIISDKDIEHYLKYAATQDVTMEPIAEEMLNKYFKATRIVRPKTLSPQSLHVLRQFAESHAKLCLRNTVNYDDVLAAINITEKYIRLLFRTDSHSSPAEPKFQSLEDVDNYKKQLYEWFNYFTRENNEYNEVKSILEFRD